MKNSRDKGNNFELLVAKAFNQHFAPHKFRRTPLSGGWSEKAEAKGDIVCVDDNDFLYCVECKNAEGWTLESLFAEKHKWFDDWWKQAVEECPAGKIPLLIFTRNHMPAFAAVLWINWMQITGQQAIDLSYAMSINNPDHIVICRFDELLINLKWSIS
jgi:hypothetical protein